MGYRIKKSEKHDYASFSQKAVRKMHRLFYRILGDRKKAYPFYRSYRHRKKKAREDGQEGSLYMTEQPAYLAGFGHGLGAWRAGLVNAERFGLSYAYTPMVNRAWDEALGLGESFPLAKELEKQGYRKVRLPYYNMDDAASRALIAEIIASYRGRKVVFHNEYEQWTGKNDDIRGDLMIRELFWKSSKRKEDRLVYKEGKKHIALHIRRGDVSSRLSQGDESMRMRWLEMSYYENVMKQLTAACSNPEKLAFYVFSEGDPADFECLKALHPDVEICVGMADELSFVHLCHADLLVTAPSSFSIIAGALGRGIKIAPDRKWLQIPATEEWIRIDSESGTIPEEALGRIALALAGESGES